MVCMRGLFDRSLFLAGAASCSVVSLCFMGVEAFAHGVTLGDKGYIQETTGVNIIPFVYLGAKHMITGYDHILFLVGVIFYLYKLRDVSLYVSLFAVGHSLTLMAGVFWSIDFNPYLIDAIIGLSVVYKALDNLDAFNKWFGISLNQKAATFIFGLCHGFGLAAKIKDFNVSPNGLFTNLVSFNVGVEIGQVLALSVILIFMGQLRRSSRFHTFAHSLNVVLMSAGFLLMEYQVIGWIIS